LKIEISSFKILFFFLNLNFIHFWRKYCIYNFKLKKRYELLFQPNKIHILPSDTIKFIEDFARFNSARFISLVSTFMLNTRLYVDPCTTALTRTSAHWVRSTEIAINLAGFKFLQRREYRIHDHCDLTEYGKNGFVAVSKNLAGYRSELVRYKWGMFRIRFLSMKIFLTLKDPPLLIFYLFLK